MAKGGGVFINPPRIENSRNPPSRKFLKYPPLSNSTQSAVSELDLIRIKPF